MHCLEPLDQNTITVGDAAPEWELVDIDGSSVNLASYWQQRPLVVVFLRHLGCIFCREQVMRLRRDYQIISPLGNIVCIAQGDHQTGKAFSILFETPFPLLMCGSDLGVYSAYGLVRGTFRQIFGIVPMFRAIKAMFGGSLQGPMMGEGMQMPGTFVVGKDGLIKLVHRHVDISDHIETAEIMAVLNTCR